MNTDRLRSLAAAALLVGLLTWAVAAGSGELWPRADFAFCNQQEIASLDPHIATGVPEARLIQALFEGLTRPDPQTLAARPAMATSWSVSADGRTWRFQLREDGLWSNGDPVTAADFAWSLRRVLSPETGAPYANLLYVIEGAEVFNATGAGELGIETRGAHELVLRLETPLPTLPALLGLPPFLPVHKGCLETHGTDWIKPGNIVTNGPFRLGDRRVRDRVRLERFEGYWGRDDVGVATIDAYAAESSTTQLNLFLTGEVDWMIKPPPTLYGELLDRPEAQVGSQCGMTFMRFNITRPPFDHPDVRAALLLALDREALARDVMRGGEQPADSFVPPGIPGYEVASLPPSDPERARRLLAASGVEVPPFELLYPHNEITRDFCAAVADQWKRELGLDVALVNQTWKVFLDSCKQLEYDVAWGAWIADYLDPIAFLEIFESHSGNNRTGWASPRYDALVAEARGEPDAVRRADLLREAEVLLLADLPLAPIYQRVNINLVAGRVRGLYDNLLDIHPLRDISVVAPP